MNPINAIYGHGLNNSKMMTRVSNITRYVFTSLSTGDAQSYSFSPVSFRTDSNSSIMENYSATKLIGTNIQFNNYFPTTPTNPIMPLNGGRRSPIPAVKKMLLSYERFGDYKQSRKYGYYDGASLIGGGDKGIGNPRFICADLITPVVGEQEITNYQDNPKYDDYIVMVGYALYNDDKTLNTSPIRHYVDIQANTTGTISAWGRNVNTPRSISSNIPISYDNRLSQFYPLGAIMDAGSGTGFDIFSTIYTISRTPYGTNKIYTYDFEYPQFTAVSPYISLCVGRVATGISLIPQSAPSLSYPVYQGRPLALFPDLSTLINYLKDFGFEVYTSLEDLMTDDGKNEEDLPDFGYTPPEEPTAVPDNSSDDVTPKPTVITPASLSKTYCLRWDQFQEFQNWIASEDFLTALSKFFSDPMDGVVSLKLYPFDFLQHDSAYLTQESNITIVHQSKDIACYKFLRQYNFVFNGGEYTYYPYYGDYNDYLAGYSIYIPFVGNCQLEPAEVVGRTLSLTYAIDILSGQCEVLLYSNSIMIRCLTGVCGLDIPLTGTNYTQAVRNAVNYAVGLGTQILTTAITGLPALGVGFSGVAAKSAGGQAMQKAAFGASAVNEVVEGAGTALQMLPQNTSQFQTKASSLTSLFAPSVPFLSVTLPQPVYPENRQQYEGFNASMTRRISTMEGYCKGTPYGDWDISGATVEEINMIKNIIQTGFYI